MAPKKLPTGITQTRSGKYAVRPWDRVNHKKGRQKLFDGTPEGLASAIAYKDKIEAGKKDAKTRHWTVKDFYEMWTTDPGYKRPKESTNLHNAERAKKFADDYGDHPLDEIDRMTARTWATKNPGRLGAVRAMFGDATLDDLIANNPFAGLRTTRGHGRKHEDPPTEKEVQKLAEIAYEKWPDWPVYGSLILTAAYTGMRIGELLALRWIDIDWANGTILIERQWNSRLRTYTSTKNDLVRTINMFEPVTEALRPLPKDGPDGLVWQSPRGARVEPNLHFYYWSQVRNQWFGSLTQDRYAKLKDLDFHTLRHFCASWMADMQIPAPDIAYQLGHTDGGKLIQTLYGHRYVDNSLARMRKAYLQRAS